MKKALSKFSRKLFIIGFVISTEVFALLSISMVGTKALAEYPKFLKSTEIEGFGTTHTLMFSYQSLVSKLNKIDGGTLFMSLFPYLYCLESMLGIKV